eukprot:403336619
MNPCQLKNKFLKVVGFVSALTLASAASSYGPQVQQTMVLADFNVKREGTVEFRSGSYNKPNMMYLKVDKYTKTINQKLSQDYDRRIQSIRVGPGARVKLCKYENCADGPSSFDKTLYDNHTANFIEIVGPYGTPLLTDGYSNWARHVQVDFVDLNPDNSYDPESYLQAFTSQDFSSGAAGLFKSGQYFQDEIGEYGSQEILKRFNSSNTALEINSMVVPEGVVATLYSNDYQGGDGWVIYGPRKVNIQKEKKEQNFTIKSLKVRDIFAVIVGKWERVVSTNFAPINTTIYRGWDQSEVQIPELTLFKLFKNIAWGNSFQFQAEFEKTTLLTRPASVKIFDATIRSLKESKISEVQVTCPYNSKANQDNIALYQWTFTVKIDGLEDFYVYDANYMCRYRDFAWSPPACPLTYCANSDCSSCTPQEKLIPTRY